MLKKKKNIVINHLTSSITEYLGPLRFIRLTDDAVLIMFNFVHNAYKASHHMVELFS